LTNILPIWPSEGGKGAKVSQPSLAEAGIATLRVGDGPTIGKTTAIAGVSTQSAAKIFNVSADRSKAPIGAVSDASAAKLLNVGERSVERATTVQRQGAHRAA